MSFFPCPRCGCYMGVVNTTIYVCCCAANEARVALLALLAAKAERDAAAVEPSP